MCPRCGKTVYAAEKVIGGGNVRDSYIYTVISVVFVSSLHIVELEPTLCSLISPGIKAAFAVPSVAKDSSPRLSLTETGRSSVKVCVQQRELQRSVDNLISFWAQN